ncbi:gamma-glutamyltransferase family protein [Macromonas nakdongensis]|uniref:gamma-glutamyltransferase family protein n=1 Tax=Macromonas nakdongensis TaxID=1843082 RepID=UPI000C34557B|nr:gamma-glutamyltransferase [Macromonas nakdongensis]
MTSISLDPAWGVSSDTAMVATGHPLAAQVARGMLQRGGSAVDAAIAADAVLGVVEPMATGIGGDVLAMLVPPGQAPVSYNGTGRSPGLLTAAAWQDLPHHKIPERHPLSVTVPGVVQAWHDLHARYGVLPWAELLAPAIAVARDGFAVAPVAAREWALFEPVLRQDPHTARLYRAGAVPRAGERYANPELAAVLTAVAHEGPAAFYLGAPARAAAQAVQHMGGVLAEADFAAHNGHFAEPVAGQFRGWTVLECPPNTHGVAVLHALAALEGQSLDKGDPQTTVAMADAMRAALKVAKETVADPAGNTVCTVVVDRNGFAITLMSSVFKRFGSGIAAVGQGFVLQNRGFGFSVPGHINGPGPAKRPYHTVVPAAVLQDGAFRACLGVVGGAMQPQGHVQLITRLAAWGEPVQAAIDAPRWRLESDRDLAVEAGTPVAIEAALRAAGYSEPAGLGELGGRSDFGGAQVVLRLPDGRLVGGSDTRKDGMALAA